MQIHQQRSMEGSNQNKIKIKMYAYFMEYAKFYHTPLGLTVVSTRANEATSTK